MRGLTLRHLRLASGAVMWVCIAWHVVNHALGLISLPAAEGGLHIAAAVWQSWSGTVILYGAFATHLVLALTGLHQRHTLLLPPLEVMRIGFGLTIPLLLFGHVVATRIAYSGYGEAAHHQRVVASLARDGSTGWQLALLAPGWLHGCIGLNVAFRHRAWYRRWRTWLIGAVIALARLAAAGYRSMIGEVAALQLATPSRVSVSAARRAALSALRGNLLTGYFGLLALVLASRSWRGWRHWRSARKTS